MSYRTMWQAMVLVTMGLGAMAQAADWPRFRGPAADGWSPDRGVNKDWTARPPKVLWTVSLSDKGHAGPCAADGKVFIIDHKDENDLVRAIDLTSGKDVWTFSYPDSKTNRHGFTNSTPLFNQGRLYTISQMGKVHCLDAKTGAKLWCRDIFKDFSGKYTSFHMVASPAIDGEKLILCPGGNGAAVVTLDCANGKTIWQGGGSSKPGYATPLVTILDGKKQYVVLLAEGLIGIDPETGARLWDVPWKTMLDKNAATPLVIDSRRIFFSTAHGRGAAMVEVSAGKASVQWQQKMMQAHFPTPVLFQGKIYGSSDPRELTCLDVQTGKILWKQRDFEYASVVGVDEVILVQHAKTGDVVMIDPQSPTYKELGRFHPFDGPDCFTAPIIADGKLLVRNLSTLACIDLK